VRERDGGDYRYRTLGQADDLAPMDGRDVLAFDQALRLVTHPCAAAPVGKLTVSKALEDHLDGLAARSKHATEYRGAAERHIVPVLGGHRVDRLTKTQIEHWLAGLVRAAKV